MEENNLALDPAALPERLQALLDHLEQGLLERGTPLRLILLAALAGEHSLLIGPPGTAKSELARRLHWAFADGDYFERLLTRFSVPEELFGPLSIKALETDRYQRLTRGYLPAASIAFIDEIFKANSAILNTLLSLLNEGVFDNGAERQAVPLRSVVAASNELPEDDTLAALYDRFICRYQVAGVSDEHFTELLKLDDQNLSPPPAPLPLSKQELIALSQGAGQVTVSAEVLTLLAALRGFLREQEIEVSDRRWRKVVKLLKTAAYCNGRDTAQAIDCLLLSHCLWQQPEQHCLIADWLWAYLGGSGFGEGLERLLHTWEQQWQSDLSSEVQARDKQGHKLHLDPNGRETRSSATEEWAQRDGLPLYLAPPDQAERTNAGRGYTERELSASFFDQHYQQCHIDGQWLHINQYLAEPDNRLMQRRPNQALMKPRPLPDELISARISELQNLRGEFRELENELRHRQPQQGTAATEPKQLWLVDKEVARFDQALGNNLAGLTALRARLDTLINNYEGLRQEPSNAA